MSQERFQLWLFELSRVQGAPLPMCARRIVPLRGDVAEVEVRSDVFVADPGPGAAVGRHVAAKQHSVALGCGNPVRSVTCRTAEPDVLEAGGRWIRRERAPGADAGVGSAIALQRAVVADGAGVPKHARAAGAAAVDIGLVPVQNAVAAGSSIVMVAAPTALLSSPSLAVI